MKTRSRTMNLKLKIYPIKTGKFMVSHINPLSQKMVRNKFKTMEEAQKHKEALEYKYSNDGLSNLREHTVENLMIKHFKDEPKSQIKKNLHLLDDFLRTFGKFKIKDITNDAMELYLDQIHKDNNYSSIYMRLVKSRFNAFFRYLRRQNIIDNDPLEKCIYKAKSARNHASTTITETDVQKLLEQAKKISPVHIYPIVLTVYETAMRSNETYNLKWKNVNLRKKTIQCRFSGDGYHFILM